MMVKLYLQILKKGEQVMKNIEALEEQISVLRRELDNLVDQKETKYDKVLDISRRLDDLIVLYISNKKGKYTTIGDNFY
ncbi:Spo0E family sporulation regulatory protein-aspartic acid phosphatase [Thermoanaerobacter kivui]